MGLKTTELLAGKGTGVTEARRLPARSAWKVAPFKVTVLGRVTTIWMPAAIWVGKVKETRISILVAEL